MWPAACKQTHAGKGVAALEGCEDAAGKQTLRPSTTLVTGARGTTVWKALTIPVFPLHLCPSQVLVYGPPAGPKSEWQVVADLSQQLLDHLRATGWRDLEQHSGGTGLAQGAAGDGGVLRLRGGGRRKRPAERREVTEAVHSEQSPAEGTMQLPAGANAAAAPPSTAAATGSAQPVFHPDGAFEASLGQAVEVSSASCRCLPEVAACVCCPALVCHAQAEAAGAAAARRPLSCRHLSC